MGPFFGLSFGHILPQTGSLDRHDTILLPDFLINATRRGDDQASACLTASLVGPAIQSEAAHATKRLTSRGVTLSASGLCRPTSANVLVRGATISAFESLRAAGGASAYPSTIQATLRSLVMKNSLSGGCNRTHESRGKCRTWKYHACICNNSRWSSRRSTHFQPCLKLFLDGNLEVSAGVWVF
jgi:hypothetical protein